MDDDQNSNEILGDLGEFENERMRKVVKMELGAYRRTRFPTTASPTERLFWLRKQNITFPNVTSLARHILGIPPTQIENERVFSLSGRIATPLRNRICTTVIDQHVSISKNYPDVETSIEPLCSYEARDNIFQSPSNKNRFQSSLRFDCQSSSFRGLTAKR